MSKIADYEVTVERTVIVRGRFKPEPYEVVVTVFNAPSAAAARRAVRDRVICVRRLPSTKP